MEVPECRQGDVWGPGGIEPGWQVVVTFSNAEMQTLLAEYDPNYGATPGVTACRPIVRAICAAVQAVGVSDGGG